MRAGRIIIVIVGALLAFMGFGAAAGGSAMVVAHATQRDGAGFYTSPTERLDTATAVLMTRVNLGSAADVGPANPLGTVRVTARPVSESGPLFIGIGPQGAVEGWLTGTSYERITDLRYRPFRTDTDLVTGERSVSPPTGQSFWVASVSGTGTQTLTWPSERGSWAVVLMNADARTGVVADVSVGARTGLLLPAGLLLGSLGLLLLIAGIGVMLVAVSGTRTAPAPVAGALVSAPGSYPARLDAHLDDGLSRWKWLVKWFLAIPHAFVLSLLWLAVIPLTFVAGVAILFTGRYPRSIFDFNVGVMRWTWRVSYYAFNTLGTDRYPPFSLHSDPTYPADFTVDYPERLSRGLVLVKWWLLALPHYLVVALFTGAGLSWSNAYGDNGEGVRVATGGGLVGLLVFVAAVVLLFSGRYPKPLYDFIMGLNRWCYRVLAYAALLRDEYPPFRLDTGGTDPGSVPVPAPPPPDRTGDLVGAGSGPGSGPGFGPTVR
jgi:uncharacterized protein DUF4389